jgi:hypothetical protein
MCHNVACEWKLLQFYIETISVIKLTIDFLIVALYFFQIHVFQRFSRACCRWKSINFLKFFAASSIVTCYLYMALVWHDMAWNYSPRILWNRKLFFLGTSHLITKFKSIIFCAPYHNEKLWKLPNYLICLQILGEKSKTVKLKPKFITLSIVNGNLVYNFAEILCPSVRVP